MSLAVMFPVLGGLLWSVAGCSFTTPVATQSADQSKQLFDLNQPSYPKQIPEVHEVVTVRVERREVAEGPAAGLTYDWIFPAEMDSDTPLVLLGHGFMRSAKRMRGLAEYLAGQGMAVACPEFRHSRPWRGGHQENARDMAELATLLGSGRRVALAGFSAGGCSALLASKKCEPEALVLLDPVFVGEGVQQAALACQSPALGLFARPSSSNASGSGRATMQVMPNAQIIDLPSASHAHFEFPLDPLARAFCGGAVDGDSDESLQQRILDEVSAFLRTHLVAAEAER